MDNVQWSIQNEAMWYDNMEYIVAQSLYDTVM